MITIIFAMLILTILAGGVGDDVCSIYPLVEEGQSAPIVQKLISTLGQNCTTFEGALSPLEKVRIVPKTENCSSHYLPSTTRKASIRLAEITPRSVHLVDA